MEGASTPSFAGREAELARLARMLDSASSGKGATVLVTAEAGLGKTRLAEEFIRLASDRGARVLRGEAHSDSFQPFSLFSGALESDMGRPLFEEKVRVRFGSVLVVGKDGVTLAKSSNTGNDAGEFASVLQAVQDFVRDSFAGAGSGLGRLEFGRTSVIIEHGTAASVAAVFEGQEHPEMRPRVRRAVSDAESGKGPQAAVDALSQSEFLVRRELDSNGLKAERFRISNLILEHLSRRATESPVTLILEDLHWADESSLFVLDFLARNTVGTRLLIVGTARPREGEASMAAVRRMLTEGTAEEMGLAGISAEAMSAIINSRYAPNTFPGEFMDKLASTCGGNPFFLMEILRQMEGDGSLVEGASGFEVRMQDYAMPATVEEAVNRRIRNMDEDTLALSEFLSCIGRSFTMDVVFGASPSRELGRCLDELGKAQVVTVHGPTGEFSHSIVHSVIYDGTAERWKATHHKAIGEFLEARHVSDREAVTFELARHFSLTREHSKAFDYACIAGEQASETFAPEQALVYYASAERIAKKLSTPPEAQLRKVESGTAAVLALLGRYDEAISRYGNVLSSSEDPLEQARIHGKLAAILTLKSDYDRAWEASERGLELLGGRDDGERARILHSMGRLKMRRGELDGARPYIDECVAIAGRLNDDSLVAMAEVAAGILNALEGKHSEAISHYAKAIEIDERRGDITALAGALNNKGLAHYGLGEIDAAYEHHTRSLALKRKIGDRYAIAGSLINLGLVHFDRGELDKALEMYAESFGIKEKLGDRYGLTLLNLYIANILSHKGDYGEAKRHYDEVMRISGETKDRHQLADIIYNIGRLNFAKEDYPEAVKGFEEAARISTEIKAHHLAVFSHLRLVETWLEAGNVAKAREHWDMAVSIRGTHFNESDFDLFLQQEGMLKSAEGDWPGSERAFVQAVELFGKRKKRKELAFTLHEYGKALMRHGDAERGKARLVEAREHFNDMGMKDWSRKASELILSNDG